MVDALFEFISDMLEKPAPLIAACIAGLVVLFGVSSCEQESPSPPPKVFPNIKETLDGLRYAKAFYEDTAATAGGNRATLAVGESTYNAARDAYRYAIEQMGDSLMMLEESFSAKDINDLLESADARAQEFYEWRFPTPHNENNESGSAQSLLPGPADVVGILLDLQSMQEERDRELRAYILIELEKCKWQSWNDVRGQ